MAIHASTWAAAIRLAEATSPGNDRFPDGITLVALTPIRDPHLVPDAIARTLGLLDIGRRPAIERLAEALEALLANTSVALFRHPNRATIPRSTCR